MNDRLQALLDNIGDSDFKNKNRLASLYSDFRTQASTNPDGYAANVSTWETLLENAARNGVLDSLGADTSVLSLRIDDNLLEFLEDRRYGRPLALSSVISEAIEENRFLPYSTFSTSTVSVYSKRWIPDPWRMVRWGLRQLGVFSSTVDCSHSANIHLVLMRNVENVAAQIVQRQKQLDTGPTSAIYSFDTFQKTFSRVTNGAKSLERSDFEILLTYMSRDRPVLSYSARTKTIKFHHSQSNSQPPITQEDVTIANLQTLIGTLQSQMNLLNEQVIKLNGTVREELLRKNQVSAKQALRRRKLVEKTLSQRGDTLFQLEGVFHKIEEAKTQVELVIAMKQSTGVLHQLHENVGGVESVEAVVDKLQEEMSKVDEVQRIMETPLADSHTANDLEINEELEHLERQDRELRQIEEAEQTREKLTTLNKVPTEGFGQLSTPEEEQGAVPAKMAVDGLKNLTIAET